MTPEQVKLIESKIASYRSNIESYRKMYGQALTDDSEALATTLETLLGEWREMKAEREQFPDPVTLQRCTVNPLYWIATGGPAADESHVSVRIQVDAELGSIRQGVERAIVEQCNSDKLRCPVCGYSNIDALIHGDHRRLCKGKIPLYDHE